MRADRLKYDEGNEQQKKELTVHLLNLNSVEHL